MRLKSDDDHSIKDYIMAIFKKWGRDFTTCELCGRKGRTHLHHTKYDKATIYDIRLVCWSCDKKHVNRFLV